MNLHELILFEDPDILAVNKPSGLLTIPDREGKESSLKSILQDRYGPVFTIHRLDRETSGLLLFAKNEKAHRHFSLLFEKRETKKIYTGLVIGTPSPANGTINAPIAENTLRKGTMIIHRRGKESVTDYEMLESYSTYSWMRFRIHTGRTHQIRVHARELGHPIVCDPVYGDGKPVFLSSFKHKFKLSKNAEEEKPLLNRLALHAFQLAVTGLDNQPLELEAPLPRDLRATLQQLSKTKKDR